MNIKQKKHYEELVEIAQSKGGEVLSDRYVQSKQKMLFRCSEGHEFEKISNHVKRDSWCPYCCRGPCKETGALLRQIVIDNGGTLLTPYTGSRGKIRVRCGEGHEWETKGSCVTYFKTWCPLCSKRDPDVEKRFRDLVVEKSGQIIGKYEGTNKPVKLRCSKNHEWTSAPQDTMRGRWCPFCAFKLDEMQDEIRKIVAENGGTYTGEYHNNRSRLTLTCDKGHVWETSANSIIYSRTWCPSCRSSLGETLIDEILTSFGISFTREWCHPDIPRRRFDFFFEYEGEKIIVEFDGKQHFEFVAYFHKDKGNFEEKQEIDKIKTYVAVSNGYKLVRIAYDIISTIDPRKRELQRDIIQQHLVAGIQHPELLYVSSVDMYEGWLLGSSVDVEVYERELSRGK